MNPGVNLGRVGGGPEDERRRSRGKQRGAKL